MTKPRKDAENTDTRQDKDAPAPANNNDTPQIVSVTSTAPVKDAEETKATPSETPVEDTTVATPTETAPEAATTEVATAAEQTAGQPAKEADAQTTMADPTPQPPKTGFLKKAFNFAVKAGLGAAVSWGLKTGAVLGAGLAGAPVWTTLLISGVSVGIGSTLTHDFFKRREQRKQGVALAPYFSKAHGKELVSKENLKVFGISTAAALVGSALYLGFHDGFFQGIWNNLTNHTPPVAPVAPAIVVTPPAPVVVVPPTHVVAPVVHVVPPVVAPVVHCASPLQQFSTLIQGHHVSAGVHDALHRAVSSNPHIQAQGVKDLGFYAQNGLGGVPKNGNVALQLFTQSAHEGNKQAMRGMLYLQHYGFDGITADKTASLAAMKSIPHDTLASKFVHAWGGAGNSVPAAKFNADAIVKGVKFACPAA